MLLFVACLATFGISCSPKELESGKDKWEKIELSASAKEIEEGETVTFETTVKGEKLEGAILYRNNTPASSPMSFNTEGVYVIVAKKNRLKDSDPITIKVKGKSVIPQEKLELSADKNSILVGETVTFKVQSQGKDVVADIYVDGAKVTNPYKFEKKGSFNVVAKKANYTDSNVVSVVVNEGNVEPEPELELTVDKNSLTVGGVVTFTVKSKGVVVTGTTITANGATIGNPWTTNTVGKFEIQANKTGYKASNKLEVNVVSATNYIKHNGVYYNADKAHLSVHTLIENGTEYIRLYTEKVNGVDVDYCVFVMDLRSNDFTFDATSGKASKGAVSQLTLVVVQPDADKGVILPGQNTQLEMINGGSVLSNLGEFKFVKADIKKLSVVMKGPTENDGGNTDINASKDTTEVKYTGAFTSLGSIDTTKPKKGLATVNKTKVRSVKLFKK